jgi:hypothetical protein
LNSPADHLAHRCGPPVVREPQVGKRWCRRIYPELSFIFGVNKSVHGNMCTFPETWLKYHSVVRFQVLTASIMKFRVFWDVAPCSLTGMDQRFRGAYCLHCCFYFLSSRWEKVSEIHGIIKYTKQILRTTENNVQSCLLGYTAV